MMAAQLQQSNGTAPLDGRPGEGDASRQPGQAGSSGGSDAGPTSLRNRAGESKSPYVSGYADSAVHWQLLDDATVALAKSENKLIYLNIGFHACHYCRLTKDDCFSHPQISSLLNSCFVPVVVDREERPDIDAIYMNYVQAVNGSGGWPLNLFLTPDLEPVFGGTYWPGPGIESDGSDGVDGSDSDGKLDFLVILRKVQKVWTEQEARCRMEAKTILAQLKEFAAEGTLGSRDLSAATPPVAGTGATVAGAIHAAIAAGRDSSTWSELAPGTPTIATSPSAMLEPKGAIAAASTDFDIDLDQLEEAYMHIASTFDATYGGFGPAPKFPTPAKLSFLQRLAHFPTAVQDVVGEREVAHATHMAHFTLQRIRDSGLRDHVGGGFARYAATADWGLPHFEKMVGENALLLGVYLDAWLSTGAKKESGDDYFGVVCELADYLTSAPVRLESGGFASAEAADSLYDKGRHMREGAYYLWTRREFDNVVGDEHESAVAAAYWSVAEHGNVGRSQDPLDEFINQNVLVVRKDVAEISRQFGIPVGEVRRLVENARAKLRAHREKERVRPETDDKAISAVNGMVIGALARTAAAVGCVGESERARRWLDTARKGAEFVRRELWDGKTLYRMYRQGRASTEGFAEDYAFLIEGLLELYEATAEEAWLSWVVELQKTQVSLFYDTPIPATGAQPSPHPSCGAFFSTAPSTPHNILRLKDGMDTAQPSTNGVSVSNLFRLGAVLANTEARPRYEAVARETVAAFDAEMLQYPWLFVGLLAGVVTARLGGGDKAVAVLVRGGHGGDGGNEAERKALERYRLSPRAEARSAVFMREGGWLAGKG